MSQAFQEKHLNIVMVSDVVCPWCAVGYKRLMLALELLQKKHSSLTVSLTVKPFELNPNMTTEGQNASEHIAEKYGIDSTAIATNRSHIKAAGAELGFEFNYGEKSRVWNTFGAHRLLAKAEMLQDTTEISIGDAAGSDAQPLQIRLKLALLDAYFTRQLQVSDPEVLVQVALDAGMNENDARDALENDSLGEEVRELEDNYRRLGVTAVPTFIFNDAHAVSGAQDPQDLARYMGEILNDGNDQPS